MRRRRSPFSSRFLIYLRPSASSASSADKNPAFSSEDTFCSPPDIRKGLVCKRIPHVILKSIAKNPTTTESTDLTDCRAYSMHALALPYDPARPGAGHSGRDVLYSL